MRHGAFSARRAERGKLPRKGCLSEKSRVESGFVSQGLRRSSAVKLEVVVGEGLKSVLRLPPFNPENRRCDAPAEWSAEVAATPEEDAAHDRQSRAVR